MFQKFAKSTTEDITWNLKRMISMISNKGKLLFPLVRCQVWESFAPNLVRPSTFKPGIVKLHFHSPSNAQSRSTENKKGQHTMTIKKKYLRQYNLIWQCITNIGTKHTDLGEFVQPSIFTRGFVGPSTMFFFPSGLLYNCILTEHKPNLVGQCWFIINLA